MVKGEKKSKVDRVLTVTYYIDPRDMRTVQIPIGRLNFLFGALGVIGVWIIAATIYVAIDATRDPVTTQSVVSERPPQAKTTDNMQASVADDTVPARARSKPILKMALKEKVVASEEAKGEEKNSDKKDKGANAIAPAKQSVESVVSNLDKFLNSQVKSARPSNVEATSNVAVVDTSTNVASGELHVRFSIKNQGKEHAKGRVYGIATYKDRSDKTFLVTSHPGFDVFRPQKTHKKMGRRFGAKRITHKKLTFPFPDDGSGNFVEVRIVVTDRASSAVDVAKISL